jgi:GTP-binding protein
MNYTFRLAIVGRPNVGKSTLYNRLTGTQHAIVHDQPGVTRDRREGKARLGPLRFIVTDTAGLEEAAEGSLQARMFEQTRKAMDEADAILFVVDGRDGLTPADDQFASMLRRIKIPVILAVNKAESRVGQLGALEAYRLGLGDPIAISAAHNEGMADLYGALAPHVEAWEEKQEYLSRQRAEAESAAKQAMAQQAATLFDDAEEEEFSGEISEAMADETSADLSDELPEELEEEGPRPPMQLAVVGRPNVGKSTLINQLIGEDRLLTGPEAGITRDAIAVDYFFNDQPLKLVDTAGMRRKSNVQQKLEQLSVGDTLRAIRYAHVVALVLDASQPLDKQDVTIASLVEREGRALVIVVNKSDTIQDMSVFRKQFDARLKEVLTQVKGVPVVMVSALERKNLHQIFHAAFRAYDIWNSRISTGELNRWLADVIDRNPPPMVSGRRIKLRYMTQNKTRPPSFVIFCSKADQLPDSYIRYLVNDMRQSFGMQGVPIRIVLRQNKNPYVPKE